MRVRVLFFGVLKEHLSNQQDTIELPSGATVSTLLARFSAIENRLWSSIAVAVNREYVPHSHLLQEGDEVALLPPVSGGHTADPAAHATLTREPIDAAAMVAAIKQGEDGAVVTFDGIVRNHTRARKTLFLDYEAYEEMALVQMQRLADEALSRFGVRAVRIAHRLGRLEIGESSVLIVVASAHRAPAFDACRWLIDTLKKTVPIWKKEHFVDGAVWADGEPFPAEIVPGSATP